MAADRIMQPDERPVGDPNFNIMHYQYDNNALFNNLRLGIHLLLFRNSGTVCQETQPLFTTRLKTLVLSRKINAGYYYDHTEYVISACEKRKVP